MKLRIVDGALLLTAIAGAVVAVSTARKLYSLQADHVRLSRTVGELIVTDPAQLHVQALENGEPLHFAWRVYLPAGRMVASAAGSGGSGSSMSVHSEPREFLARVRLTQSRTGQIAIYYNFGSSSGYRTVGSAEAFQFLREHRDELHIEQLGVGATVRAKPGESVKLLHISMPESLAAQARSNPPDGKSLHLAPDILECRLRVNP